MSVQRTLQKYMDNWKRISHLDFCLLLEDNSVFVTTCEKRLPSAAKLDDFRQSTALCLANTTCCLYKITEKSDVPYLLVVWGSDASVSTIGELAVCQIQSILEGFSEKNDKNSFMQKLLLGNYTEVEALTVRANCTFPPLHAGQSSSLQPDSRRMNMPWQRLKISFLHARTILSLRSMTVASSLFVNFLLRKLMKISKIPLICWLICSAQRP